MIRSIVGDAVLKKTLQDYRKHAQDSKSATSVTGPADMARIEDPKGFQRVLEQNSHQDLGWLFDDWVYNDRGLADLSITSVTPRSLPARNGKDTSWLIAVEIHNAGAVNVDVPVTVRSGNLTSTERVRIGPQSTVSTRVVFEGTPVEVVVNDGTVPETTAPTHVERLKLTPPSQ
jgi:hypothetical protein